MHIHEYQAKELLRGFGIPTPGGKAVFALEEVEAAAKGLKGPPWVVKAQIHAGGRGAGHFADNPKGKGGVRICASLEEVQNSAQAMLGKVLVTKQTGASGHKVGRLYLEEACEIDRELYLSALIDRSKERITFVACGQGGMAIEELAEKSPEKICKVAIDPTVGVLGFQALRLAQFLGLEGHTRKEFFALLKSIYQVFLQKDADLIEINPLVVQKSGALLALDAKMGFDESALFRHADVASLHDGSQEEKTEREAKVHDLSYVKLEGNIGCLVNGAGLAMATMDLVQQKGGAPANFLDVGGGADQERVAVAFRIILSDPAVKTVLVNIFGGIMRCDTIAHGIVAAAKETGIKVPLVVRLEGTNVKLGRKILEESGLAIVSAENFDDAAQKAVQATKE